MNYSSSAYDLSLFEPRPKIKKVENPYSDVPKIVQKCKPVLRIVEKTPKQKRLAIRYALKVYISILMVFSSLFASCFLIIYPQAESEQLNRQIISMEQKIKEAESESIRLNNALNAKVTFEKVDEYATKVLGMRKTESYQITFVDLSDNRDRVLYSQNSIGKYISKLFQSID